MPLRGWLDVAWRVKAEVSGDHVSLIAAGLALYGLLAAFPALAATVSLYGLFASPAQVADQIELLLGVLPQEALQILREQLQELARQQSEVLGFGAALAVSIALWSARKGITALMTATNIAYDEQESRGFIRQVLISLAFVVGAVAAFVGMLLLTVVTPLLLEVLGLPQWLHASLGALRWAVLWVLVVAGLALLYRFAPHRRGAKIRWVSWGAGIAATVWLAGSVLFSLYVRNFASYGETYGALGGVVVLLMWFYLSGFAVILGAEINAELEHQTERDTTRGPNRSMGNRGAYVADTLGEVRR
jgi:membrane protein